MEDNFISLQNHFLIAMPLLNDFNFARAVVYICAHTRNGAMGVIVNRQISEINLGEVMAQMDINITNEAVSDVPVFLGGPVQPERGFIIHPPFGSWQSTLLIGDNLAVTSSQDILHAMAKGDGPEEFLVILGYVGWEEGQLEEEVANNYWLTTPAVSEILFHTPSEDRWKAAAALIGIDIANISSETGHA
ncbi:MAG: YqgE/AlgH family protein [Legionellales bacterium]|nr:YqgE/AlgH family protein [Legionellales bacterium]